LLEARGYRIAARNLRIGRAEVDLVARRGSDVVFCEVKTRRGRSFGIPEEAVHARKRERILRAARGYLSRHPATRDVRFDVIAVSEEIGGELRLRHIPGAFRAW
jgi:putative endonuclease